MHICLVKWTVLNGQLVSQRHNFTFLLKTAHILHRHNVPWVNPHTHTHTDRADFVPSTADAEGNCPIHVFGVWSPHVVAHGLSTWAGCHTFTVNLLSNSEIQFPEIFYINLSGLLKIMTMTQINLQMKKGHPQQQCCPCVCPCAKCEFFDNTQDKTEQ